MILKYKEWAVGTHPKEARWVYDLTNETPTWNERKEEYVFKKEPQRLDPREAKKLMQEHKMECVYSDANGMIYK